MQTAKTDCRKEKTENRETECREIEKQNAENKRTECRKEKRENRKLNAANTDLKFFLVQTNSLIEEFWRFSNNRFYQGFSIFGRFNTMLTSEQKRSVSVGNHQFNICFVFSSSLLFIF